MTNTQAGHQVVIDYLIASKRCEAKDLEHFLALGTLMTNISDLVHKVQRERGASNLFLASRGKQFSLERQQLCCVTDAGISDFHKQLPNVEEAIYHVHSGTRLFNRIAHALHMLDALTIHRAKISSCELAVEDATREYNHVVQALLAIVFETADAAIDPILSATLVAMFNFMQLKEFAGQERAAGARGFAGGLLDDEQREQLQYLIDSQQRCYEVFSSFAGADITARWQRMSETLPMDDIDRLRLLLTRRRAGDHQGIKTDPELASRWFLLTTQRIDVMKELEEVLARELRLLCERRLREAQDRLQHHESLIPMLQENTSPPALSPEGIKTESRPLMELLQFQAQRLQQMNEELNEARTALEERKLVERAKYLIMKHRGLSEEDAHRLMRQMAMNQSRRLVEIARSVIELAGVWS